MKKKFNTDLLWMVGSIIFVLCVASVWFWGSYTVFERKQACLEHGYSEYTSGYCIRLVDGNTQTVDVKRLMEE